MHFKIFSFLFLLLLCSHSWAACESVTPNYRSPYIPSGYTSKSCFYSPSSCSVCINNNPSFTDMCSIGEQLLNAGQGSCPPTFVPYIGAGFVLSGATEICGRAQSTCNGNSSGCIYQYKCDNKCEADSVRFGGTIQECQYDVVENRWYRWVCHSGSSCSAGTCGMQYYSDESLCKQQFCQENPSSSLCCDSTKWECHTYTETSQTTVASDNITCIDGTCWGLTYCEYITRNTTECDNECGTHTEQTNEIPMTYEGACNPDYLDDDNMCSKTKCIESNGQYSLYQMCQSRMINNGEIQLLPRMVGGGKGSCKNAGYPPENGLQNDSTGTSSDSLNIPLECFQFGINCPEPDSSLTDPENRTPENGCICEPFDGQKDISQIVCPDGSISVIYSSCDNWKNRPLSSSSSDTPESSSSAEQSASSGGSFANDWTTWSQGEDIKAALAVIAANTAKSGNYQVVVQQNQEYLNQFEYQDDGIEPTLNIPDSMLTYDSMQVDTNDILQAIFGRLDSSNKILDTISTTSGVCPCLTFFSGNQNTSFANGHIHFKELVIDMANFHGFNLCTIISAIVVALASVVSFFIGFSIFKNISQ